jgi:hypothetical protein
MAGMDMASHPWRADVLANIRFVIRRLMIVAFILAAALAPQAAFK